MTEYVIYKVTNKINGKMYIGQTNNFEKRKREHTTYDINDSCLFHRALRKYGLDNFTWEIIDNAESKKEADMLERYYIEQYRTYKNSGIGYNMTKGGDGGSMWNASPVVKLTLEGEYVKRYDSAGECRIDGYHDSDVLRSCRSNSITCKGFMFMFERDYIKNGPKKYIKPDNNCKKKIDQYSISGDFIKTFNSVQEAADITGSNRSSISGCLSGIYKTANGFIWTYHGEPIKDINDHNVIRKGIPIYQLSKNGDILNSFDRITDAGKALGVNYKSIHKVLDNPNRTAFGYKWVTKSNYDSNKSA